MKAWCINCKFMQYSGHVCIESKKEVPDILAAMRDEESALIISRDGKSRIFIPFYIEKCISGCTTNIAAHPQFIVRPLRLVCEEVDFLIQDILIGRRSNTANCAPMKTENFKSFSSKQPYDNLRGFPVVQPGMQILLPVTNMQVINRSFSAYMIAESIY